MKKFLKTLLLVSPFLFASCDDVFPDNISWDEMRPITPEEGAIITRSPVQFRWNTLKGAENYRLQVFEEQTMLIDSLISGSFYDYTIEAGSYRWRVRGENSAFETTFSPLINFSVVTE